MKLYSEFTADLKTQHNMPEWQPVINETEINYFQTLSALGCPEHFDCSIILLLMWMHVWPHCDAEK